MKSLIGKVKFGVFALSPTGYHEPALRIFARRQAAERYANKLAIPTIIMVIMPTVK